MGSITIQVIGDSSVGTKSKSYTFSDSDINRLVNWSKAVYATIPTPQNPTPLALTVAQALAAWADGLIAGTKANVVSWEKITALSAVPDPGPLVST